MRNLILLFFAASLILSSCEKKEVVKPEIGYEGGVRTLHITTVNNNQITLRNNSGKTLDLSDFLITTSDSLEKEEVSSEKLLHSKEFVYTSLKPIHLSSDTISLYRVDSVSAPYSDTTLIDQLLPIGAKTSL